MFMSTGQSGLTMGETENVHEAGSSRALLPDRSYQPPQRRPVRNEVDQAEAEATERMTPPRLPAERPREAEAVEGTEHP